MATTSVRVAPITDADVADVAAFLHCHLNQRVTPDAWERAMRAPWQQGAPNHGFHLRAGEQVVGAYLALYSTRTIDGRAERFCNLAAWCVLDEHRARSVRLIRSLLGQDGYHFVDLSPSGNVIPLNERLGFEHLDTTTAVVPNAVGLLAAPLRRALTRLRRRSRVTLTSAPGELDAALDGEAHRRYVDHQASPAVIHLLLRRGGRAGHVMVRRDRRKGLPLFASVLHASDRELLAAAWPSVCVHLLTRHRVLFTLAERRTAGRPPRWSVRLRRPRPKMYRSATLAPEQIDNLYSELTELAW